MSAWRKYILINAAMLAATAVFIPYALFLAPNVPAFRFHCPLHNYFHLYCPLCGGTRAVAALCRGEWRAAVMFDPVLLPLALAVLFFDARALWLLLHRPGHRLLPAVLPQAALCLVLLDVALRNTLLFFGIDPTGDFAAYWTERLSPWRAALGGICLFAGAFTAAVFFGLTARRRALPWGIVLIGFGVAFAVVLTGLWRLLFLLLPLCGWFAADAVRQKKKTAAGGGEAP